ncbi:hypothetical protein [Nocardioides sp.]|uniref:hypothetical protein n=1 Tax=Nocardioides sp. TaxID=35761 RepID=UPI003D0C525A
MNTGTDIDFDRKLEQILAARERQEAKHAKGLLTLLNGRDDLRGVHALADMVGERVLWCA